MDVVHVQKLHTTKFITRHKWKIDYHVGMPLEIYDKFALANGMEDSKFVSYRAAV